MPNLRKSIHLHTANLSTYLTYGLRICLSQTGEATWMIMEGLWRVDSIWAELTQRCNGWTRQVLNLAGSQGALITGKWQSCSLGTSWVWYFSWEQKWKAGEKARDAAKLWRLGAYGGCLGLPFRSREMWTAIFQLWMLMLACFEAAAFSLCRIFVGGTICKSNKFPIQD